jgi:5-methylcytosine-specific restriction endonuclease McrA
MAKPRKSENERKDDSRIMKLFRGRCVVCLSPATEVHELITRARSKDATILPQNRVPLCRSCHRRSHFDGYTGDKEDLLRSKAIERLIMFDVSLEAW